MKWTTIDEQVLEIKDMSTEHIKNCVKMVERNIDKQNRMSASSYYMKEIHYEVDYSESTIWCTLNKELGKR